MSDKDTSIQELKEIMKKFVRARSWEQYHSPKNLSASLAIEVAELMEHFQWLTEEQSREIKSNKEKMAHVHDEIADVASYLLGLCNVLGVDLSDAMRSKMEKNNKKYPPGVQKEQIHKYTYSKRSKGGKT
ncbi:MAG: nucleotide pyrophosphohydrolase [Candidatus Omnitrophica bacterium]|nr:nucleotide pyrophosphohydrolase [Candidatus Omnitrophota bacterium]